MRRYRAIFDPFDRLGFNTLSFEALDISDALALLARLNCRKPIQLWCDGAYFARVQWIVEGQACYWRLLGEFASAWLPASRTRRLQARPLEDEASAVDLLD